MSGQNTESAALRAKTLRSTKAMAAIGERHARNQAILFATPEHEFDEMERLLIVRDALERRRYVWGRTK